MKTIINNLLKILLLTLVMGVLWMISLYVGGILFPSEMKQPQVAPEVVMALLFLTCLINSWVLYITAVKSVKGFLHTSLVIGLVIFGVQYFLSMIEAYFFNFGLQMPVEGIKGILAGGVVFSILISPVIVRISGSAKKQREVAEAPGDPNTPAIKTIKILLLGMIVYPLIYNLAGYYIAWQFEAVRLFWSGSPAKEPFINIMAANFKSGLMFLAMFRGIVFVLIGLAVYHMVQMKPWQKGILIGALFALIMNSQHLLPNPYFPAEVTLVHFIETASSNFIWGCLVAWTWAVPFRGFKQTSHEKMVAVQD